MTVRALLNCLFKCVHCWENSKSFCHSHIWESFSDEHLFLPSVYPIMTYVNSSDYVIELRCEKGKKRKYNKKISLKICTKQGVNLRMRCGNGSPE